MSMSKAEETVLTKLAPSILNKCRSHAETVGLEATFVNLTTSWPLIEVNAVMHLRIVRLQVAISRSYTGAFAYDERVLHVGGTVKRNNAIINRIVTEMMAQLERVAKQNRAVKAASIASTIPGIDKSTLVPSRRGTSLMNRLMNMPLPYCGQRGALPIPPTMHERWKEVVAEFEEAQAKWEQRVDFALQTEGAGK